MECRESGNSLRYMPVLSVEIEMKLSHLLAPTSKQIFHLMLLLYDIPEDDRETFQWGYFKCDKCYRAAYGSRNNIALRSNGSNFRGNGCAKCETFDGRRQRLEEEIRQQQPIAQQEQGQLHPQQTRLEPEPQTGQEPAQPVQNQPWSTMHLDDQSQQSGQAV